MNRPAGLNIDQNVREFYSHYEILSPVNSANLQAYEEVAQHPGQSIQEGSQWIPPRKHPRTEEEASKTRKQWMDKMNGLLVNLESANRLKNIEIEREQAREGRRTGPKAKKDSFKLRVWKLYTDVENFILVNEANSATA